MTIKPEAPPETGTLSELNVKPGDVVQIVRGGKNNPVDHFDAPSSTVNKQKGVVALGGSYTYDYDARFRIISRAAPPVDLTAIREPFGLLDEVYGPGTQEAMRSHGGPYEMFDIDGKWSEWEPRWSPGIAYRVKPAPKVETVTFDGWVNEDGCVRYGNEHGCTPIRATFNRVDGKIDLASYRVEPRT